MNDLFNYSQLVALGGGFNVLEVNILIFSSVNNLTQEGVDTIIRTNSFKTLNTVLDSELLIVLGTGFNNKSKVLSVVS